EWMLGEAEVAGLQVDSDRKADLLGHKPPYVAPDPRGRQHESLQGSWWIAEFWPKIVHRQDNSGQWQSRVWFNLGRHRFIMPRCVVHPSVEERINANLGYQPPNLPADRKVLQ